MELISYEFNLWDVLMTDIQMIEEGDYNDLVGIILIRDELRKLADRIDAAITKAAQLT